MSECINRGGGETLVCIDGVPTLEREYTLSPQAVESLARWQARPGEIVTMVDSQGSYYRGRLTSLGNTSATVIPFFRYDRSVESPIAVEVYQALPEKERFELVLQKLTEIGVTRIVPFTSRRSTTLDERDSAQKKSHRWPDVVLRAAKQCRRARIPELHAVCSWDDALYHAGSADLKIILSDRLAQWTLGEALDGQTPRRVAMLVGPEGGFDEEELSEAQGFGFLPVVIGPRVFRTETAAIVGASLIQYVLGDLR